MNSNTHTIKRLITGLALGILLAALTVPSALAGGASRYGAPDGWYPYAVSLTESSTTSRYGPLDPWALRYLASHTKATNTIQRANHGLAPNGGTRYELGLVSGKLGSPDPKDAPAQALPSVGLVPTRLGSPDPRDSTQAATTSAIAGGFDWGDFGIGIAAALGAICLVAVSIRLLTAHKSRKQPGSVATA